MPITVKPKKVTFKHAEAEWYNYHNTLKEIARLREEIMSPFDEEPEDVHIVKGANSARMPGNPTERIAIRLTTSKHLAYLSQVAGAIEQVYNALPDNYKMLIRVKYWSKRRLTWDQVADEIHVNRVTAMRWRNNIIQATLEVLGWR